MKRKIAGLLAALMVLSVGTTVMAASPEVETVSTSVSGIEDAKDVTLVETTSDVVTAIKVDPSEVDVTEEAVAEAAKVEASKVDVVAVMDVKVTLADGAKWPAEGITLTFTVKGITKSDNIKVLHYNGKVWETVKATPGNGTVEATFTSLSPVAIIKLPAGADITGTVSPATGSTAPVVAVVAMICLAGVVVCGKKVKFNA